MMRKPQRAAPWLAPLLVVTVLAGAMLSGYGGSDATVRLAAANPGGGITACPPTQAPMPSGPSGTITDPRPTFSWSSVPGAETYTLYVLRVSDGQWILRKTLISGTSFTPTSDLPSGVDMRWKVKGECGAGTYAGPYSPDTYFRVEGGAPCPPNQAPTGSMPSGSITDPRPTFSWSGVPGAHSYTLYVLRVSDEAWIVRAVGLTITTYTPASDLPIGVDMRWKVKAESACGPGPYSADLYFRVESTGSLSVRITSPAQGSTVSGQVNVVAEASAPARRVEFYVDGALQWTDYSAPFTFNWSTTANPLPTPNHLMDFGYWFVEYKNEADFDRARAEVNGYTNLYFASIYSYNSDLPVAELKRLLNRSLAHAVAEGKRIHLQVDPTYLHPVLDTAAPYWSGVSRVEVAGESRISRSRMQNWVNTVKGAVSARGLPHPPQGYGAYAGYGVPLPDWKNAPGLDWIGIEGYLDFPGSPVSQVNVDRLYAELTARMSEVPVTKKILLIMMAYDRNGAWTNIDTLRDLQTPVYLIAHNNPRVITINMFAYTRPGGSRNHPELKTPHRLIGERILGRQVPGAALGPRTVMAKAYDANGNSAIDRVSLTVTDGHGATSAELPPASINRHTNDVGLTEASSLRARRWGAGGYVPEA